MALSGNYGNTATSDGTNIAEGGCTLYLLRVQLPDTGTSSSITARLSYYSASGEEPWDYAFVIYADSSGEPGSLLAHVHGTHTDESGTVASVTETIEYNFSSSGYYWIGVFGQGLGPQPYASSTSGATARYYMNCTWSETDPPATGSTAGTEDTPWNAYNMEVYITFPEGGASSTSIFRRRLNILLRLCFSSISTLFGRLVK